MHVNPDLLALLALGETLGTAEERSHLEGCPACQEDLAALQGAVAVGRRTSEQDVLLAPPPQVWQRISQELGLHAGPRSPINGTVTSRPAAQRASAGHDRPVGASAPSGAAARAGEPTVAGTSGPDQLAAGAARPLPGQRPTSRSLRAASLALAAVLALAVGIGLGANLDAMLPGRTERAAVQLNALPPWSGSSGRAVVEEDRDGNRWLVVQISSPEPATGPREVWLTNTRADPMVAVGFLQDDRGRFPLPPDLDLKNHYLVDISQEPAADPDPHHSGQSMLRGKLPV